MPPHLESHKYAITIICDGKSALDKTNVPVELVKTKFIHSDFLSILSHLTTDSKFRFIREHVRGHQDDYQGPLIVKEYLNCKMDALAKSIVMTYMDKTSSFNFHPLH